MRRVTALLFWLKTSEAREPKQMECRYRPSRFQEGRNGRRRPMAEIDWFVILGKTDQLLERDCDTAVPARWAWVPANSKCKVANAVEQTRSLMIIEFSHANDQEISQNQEMRGSK
jgi:hypothetical protein